MSKLQAARRRLAHDARTDNEAYEDNWKREVRIGDIRAILKALDRAQQALFPFQVLRESLVRDTGSKQIVDSVFLRRGKKDPDFHLTVGDLNFARTVRKELKP